MDRNTIGVAVIALLAVAVAGGVIVALQSGPAGRDAAVTAPGVRVETDTDRGDTKVEAPYTRVEKNEDGVRVQAPGVDIKVPKSTEQ